MFLNLIMLGTTRCNADCRYCFVQKEPATMDAGDLGRIFRAVEEYAAEHDADRLYFFWQGGEAMLLGPDWYRRMHDLAGRVFGRRQVQHHIQTNMLAYDDSWGRVINEVFGGSVSTSMDFPNIHRRLGGSCEAYSRGFLAAVRRARDDGIVVRAISVLNAETGARGARAFYDHCFKESGFKDIQINFPYYLGASADFPAGMRPQLSPLCVFFEELIDIVVAEAQADGVEVSPISEMIKYFGGNREDPASCIWSTDCTRDFACIGPRGDVSLCDCWVAGMDKWREGNVLKTPLGRILAGPVRKRLAGRPASLYRSECGECRYLSVCHGGCPLRAEAFHGDFRRPDHYCPVYQAIFARVESAVAAA